MNESNTLFAFSTSNYDAMKKFLTDFGFQVRENSNPLVPIFNTGRGASIKRGNLDFNLEESTSGPQKASFCLLLSDYTVVELERIRSLGYKSRDETSIYGKFHSFPTPDGGTFTIAMK